MFRQEGPFLQPLQMPAAPETSKISKRHTGTMDIRVVSLVEKAGLIHELHTYKLIARMNDYDFKLVKIRREFIWHRHDETDEVFMVIDGTLRIDLRDRVLELNAGDLAVIPKGVDHKPVSDEICTVLLIEPSGTANTGNAGGPLTDTDLEWI